MINQDFTKSKCPFECGFYINISKKYYDTSIRQIKNHLNKCSNASIIDYKTYTVCFEFSDKNQSYQNNNKIILIPFHNLNNNEHNNNCENCKKRNERFVSLLIK